MGPTMGMKLTDTKILKPCRIWSEKGDLINKKARGKNSWRDRIWDFQTYSPIAEQRLEVEMYIPYMIHQQFWPNWQPMSKVGSKESGKNGGKRPDRSATCAKTWANLRNLAFPSARNLGETLIGVGHRRLTHPPWSLILHPGSEPLKMRFWDFASTLWLLQNSYWK